MNVIIAFLALQWQRLKIGAVCIDFRVTLSTDQSQTKAKPAATHSVTFFPALRTGSSHLLCVDYDWLLSLRPPVQISYVNLWLIEGQSKETTHILKKVYDTYCFLFLFLFVHSKIYEKYFFELGYKSRETTVHKTISSFNNLFQRIIFCCKVSH